MSRAKLLGWEIVGGMGVRGGATADRFLLCDNQGVRREARGSWLAQASDPVAFIVSDSS